MVSSCQLQIVRFMWLLYSASHSLQALVLLLAATWFKQLIPALLLPFGTYPPDPQALLFHSVAVAPEQTGNTSPCSVQADLVYTQHGHNPC